MKKYLNKVQEYFDKAECMFAFDDVFVNKIDEINYCQDVFKITEQLWTLACNCKTDEQYNLINETVKAITGWTLEQFCKEAWKYSKDEGGLS